MRKCVLFLVLFNCLIGLRVMADQFVPDFNSMKIIRCDIEETLYNTNNSIVSRTKYFRIFRLDDENKKIYLQKAPVDWLLYYDSDKIRFTQQPLADEYMMTSNVILDRLNNTYSAKTQITYDNPVFESRHSEASGTCRFLK